MKFNTVAEFILMVIIIFCVGDVGFNKNLSLDTTKKCNTWKYRSNSSCSLGSNTFQTILGRSCNVCPFVRLYAVIFCSKIGYVQYCSIASSTSQIKDNISRQIIKSLQRILIQADPSEIQYVAKVILASTNSEVICYLPHEMSICVNIEILAQN